jgi:hypothetical protein
MSFRLSSSPKPRRYPSSFQSPKSEDNQNFIKFNKYRKFIEGGHYEFFEARNRLIVKYLREKFSVISDPMSNSLVYKHVIKQALEKENPWQKLEKRQDLNFSSFLKSEISNGRYNLVPINFFPLKYKNVLLAAEEYLFPNVLLAAEEYERLDFPPLLNIKDDKNYNYKYESPSRISKFLALCAVEPEEIRELMYRLGFTNEEYDFELAKRKPGNRTQPVSSRSQLKTRSRLPSPKSIEFGRDSQPQNRSKSESIRNVSSKSRSSSRSSSRSGGRSRKNQGQQYTMEQFEQLSREFLTKIDTQDELLRDKNKIIEEEKKYSQEILSQLNKCEVNHIKCEETLKKIRDARQRSKSYSSSSPKSPKLERKIIELSRQLEKVNKELKGTREDLGVYESKYDEIVERNLNLERMVRGFSRRS